MGLDDQRGSDISLYALYYLVTAAEEEDLLEEWRRARAEQRQADYPGESETTIDNGPRAAKEQETGDAPLSFMQPFQFSSIQARTSQPECAEPLV